MSSQKPLTSPKGTLLFGAIHSPSTKFNELGEYVAVMIFSDEETQKFIETLEANLEGFRQSQGISSNARKNIPYKKVIDQEGKETGQISFKFGSKAKIIREDKEPITIRPVIFDEAGKPYDVDIGSGSELKVSYVCHYWSNPGLGYGVSLRLKAVQVLDLREPQASQRDAEYYGFTFEGENDEHSGQEADEEEVSF
ncbi:MAG: hypothetical protein J0G29_02455 [Alphaproteobacteria bacterium]|nr:hypothetical protein [Alphaproteobacteria bacterium]OJV45476.1 MAG: hypothetical protein BGO28_05115 [Alphaproteobacteria bacterium 43-37]